MRFYHLRFAFRFAALEHLEHQRSAGSRVIREPQVPVTRRAREIRLISSKSESRVGGPKYLLRP
jgi:hypothetical protein